MHGTPDCKEKDDDTQQHSALETVEEQQQAPDAHHPSKMQSAEPVGATAVGGRNHKDGWPRARQHMQDRAALFHELEEDEIIVGIRT